jgi:hypothetical protein
LQPDGSSRAIDLQYEVRPIAEGHALRIGAGDFHTIQNLINKDKKEFPQLDPQAAMEFARARGVVALDDEFELSVDFSPRAVFGGVVTAIWLYLIKETGRAFMDWGRLIECIADVQKHGGTFRYFVDGLPGLKGPHIDLGHKIVVRSVPQTGELIAYVEVLSTLRIGGVFAKARPPVVPFEHIYVYDLLGKTERSSEFSIEASEFDRQHWSNVGLDPTNPEAVRARIKDGLNVLEGIYRRRHTSMTDDPQ